jgi:hypothetical protein
MANGFFLYSLEYSQKFPGWYFYEMFGLPPHKNTQKIYKRLSSLWYGLFKTRLRSFCVFRTFLFYAFGFFFSVGRSNSLSSSLHTPFLVSWFSHQTCGDKTRKYNYFYAKLLIVFRMQESLFGRLVKAWKYYVYRDFFFLDGRLSHRLAAIFAFV